MKPPVPIRAPTHDEAIARAHDALTLASRSGVGFGVYALPEVDWVHARKVALYEAEKVGGIVLKDATTALVDVTAKLVAALDAIRATTGAMSS